jgi:hypothetical protein
VTVNFFQPPIDRDGGVASSMREGSAIPVRPALDRERAKANVGG